MANAYQWYTFKTLKNSHVISDEGFYKLGLVLRFRNGLYLPIAYVYQYTIKNSHVISNESAYKLGLVLLFSYESINLEKSMSSLMKALTN